MLSRTFASAFLSLCFFCAAAFPVSSVAQQYSGAGIVEGVDQAQDITEIEEADAAVIINDIIYAILNFTALLATFAIIIAGIYLIVSNGSEEQKDKAKKIIYYTLAGLIVILMINPLFGIITDLFG